MYDALEELSDLSIALQKSAISLGSAHRMICRQIEVFFSRKETMGVYYAEACRAVEEGKFRSVDICASACKERERDRKGTVLSGSCRLCDSQTVTRVLSPNCTMQLRYWMLTVGPRTC